MLDKIQPLFKSFLILICIDVLCLSLVLLFLEVRFLVPSVIGLLILNSSFFLSSKKRFLKSLKCSILHPEDHYGIHSLIKNQKTKIDHVHFYISKLDYPFSLSFQNKKKSWVVISDSLWSFLTEREKIMLIRYHLFCIKQGWTLLSTLLSSLLFGIEKFFYFLNRPRFLFKKRPKNHKNKAFLLLLKTLGLLTQKSYLKKDQKIVSEDAGKQTLALLLWKIQSLYQLQRNPIPLYLTPLLLGNPLTSLKEGCYIALQPDIRVRVRSLTGSYPP